MCCRFRRGTQFNPAPQDLYSESLMKCKGRKGVPEDVKCDQKAIVDQWSFASSVHTPISVMAVVAASPIEVNKDLLLKPFYPK